MIWTVLGTDPLVAILKYSAGPGSANALLVGVESGLIVISPPPGASESVFEATSRFGPIRALIASNAFHYLGLGSWKAKYPHAELFAPAQSIGRVASRTRLKDIRPLAQAAHLGGTRLTLTDMPHYRTGEALVRIRMGDGLAWYVTDVILNLPRLPAHPIVRLVFACSGSAPGLRVNRIGPLFMVKDRRALLKWLSEEAQRDAPRWLIPAHGDVADLGPTPQRLVELLRAG